MADATLDAIEEAIFAVLQTLKVDPATPPASATDAKPFRMVERFAGQIDEHGQVDAETIGRTPAALFAFEQSIPEGDDGAHAQDAPHEIQVVERHVFQVYVIVSDARGDVPAVKGTPGQQGILRCARVVKEAIAGLRIDGLFDGDVVRLVSHRWRIIEAGLYVQVVRFSARAALPDVAPTTPGTPFVPQGHVVPSAPDTDGHDVVVAPFSLD